MEIPKEVIVASAQKTGFASSVEFDAYRTMLTSFAEEIAEYVKAQVIEECQQHYVGAVGTHASAHNSAVKRCVETIKELK